MFLSELHVAHIDGLRWRLTRPLVWEGRWQLFVVREGFVTDFASIPKPVRWLLDSAGGNSEAAVLHDAVWRESKRPTDARVDPWFADGIFRRALRETGTPALTRGLMWFAVRAAAMARGRFGRLGPPWWVKILQLLGIFALGVIAALGPTLVAVAGLIVYWVASWVVAVCWHLFERWRLHESTNWPWPAGPRSTVDTPPGEELLVIVDKPEGDRDALDAADTAAGRLLALLAQTRTPASAEIDRALAG